MQRRVRALTGSLALAFLVTACGLPLPGPIEIEGGLLGFDGVPVTLSAPEFASNEVAVAASATFRGIIPETTFSVDATGVPELFRRLVRIRSLTEEVSLAVTLTAASADALPPSFAVTSLTIGDIVLRKGATLVWSGSFAATGGSMTFTKGACGAGGCAYVATSQPALADVELTGSVADTVAKEFAAGGSFTISAVVTVTVAEPLPDDTIIYANLISLGAVLE